MSPTKLSPGLARMLALSLLALATAAAPQQQLPPHTVWPGSPLGPASAPGPDSTPVPVLARRDFPQQCKGVFLLFHGCKNSAETWVTGPEEQRTLAALHAEGYWTLAISSAAAEAALRASGPGSGGCWDTAHMNGRVNTDVRRALSAVTWAVDAFPASKALPWFVLGVSSGGAFASGVASQLGASVHVAGLASIVAPIAKAPFQAALQRLAVIGDAEQQPQPRALPRHVILFPMLRDGRLTSTVRKQAHRLSAVQASVQGADLFLRVHALAGADLSLHYLHTAMPALPLPQAAHLLVCLAAGGAGALRHDVDVSEHIGSQHAKLRQVPEEGGQADLAWWRAAASATAALHAANATVRLLENGKATGAAKCATEVVRVGLALAGRSLQKGARSRSLRADDDVFEHLLRLHSAISGVKSPAAAVLRMGDPVGADAPGVALPAANAEVLQNVWTSGIIEVMNAAFAMHDMSAEVIPYLLPWAATIVEDV